MISKNDIVTLEIIGVSSDGTGVGRLPGGFVAFVPNTAPGDVIEAHITKVLTDRAYGRINRIIEPSPDRIQPDCGVFHKCGGCSFRHINYQAELKLKLEKVAETLKRVGGLEAAPETIIPSPIVCGYRNKAQFPFGVDENGEICLGFYANRSHRIIKIDRCLQTPEIFQEIQKAVLGFANKNKLSVYDEETGKGLLRHLFLRYGEKTGEIMVCLVINGDKLPGANEFVSLLTEKFTRVTSVILNINKKRTNVITGKENVLLFGSEYITDIICGLKIKISPNSFYQVNRSAAEILYNTAKDLAGLSGGENLLDLFCGIGVIGLSMAGSCARVTGVETVPEAVEDAAKNARINSISNAEFFCADAADTYPLNSAVPDVLILDPPRKGCDARLLSQILGSPPQKIIYISCDPATLARDLRVLTENAYIPRKVIAVDMFPRTAHVETVVYLHRI